jgi:predicted permease
MWTRFQRWIRKAADEDLEREVRAHLALEAEEREEGGLTAQEARHAARRAFGNTTGIKEETRAMWEWSWVEQFVQDLRYTARTLRRDASLTMFAVLIIGLGVGASATVFSVVNAVLLRPLPFPDPERLVWISNIADDGVSEWKVQVNHFLDLREQSKSFEGLTAYFGFVERGGKMLTGDGEPERLSSVQVAESFFPFLGVQPLLGRWFTPQECQNNGPRAALVSFDLWQRRFSSDPGVVGRTIVLDGAPTTLAGVLPPSFDFGAVFSPGTQVDVFTPFPLSEQTNRWGNTLAVIGRLKPGAAIEGARAEFTALGERLTREHTERNTVRPKLTALAERVSGRFRPALLALAWAVGGVMLIVCANLSNLQLARLAKRRKEMAVRVALGAGRGRLIRQALLESLALSCCGAAVGLLAAVAGTRAIAGLEAFSIPLLETVRVDAAAFVFTALVATLTGLLFGLMPALRAPIVVVHDELKDRGRGGGQSRKDAWTRGALVVSEVALACVLLVGAGLLIRSFLSVLDVDLGFQPERVAALRVDPDPRADISRRIAYFNEALSRVRALPGVQGAALSDMLPLGGNRSWGVAGKGQLYARDAYPQGFVRVVSDGYFAAMGVPLAAGRDFTPRDLPDSEPVVILNEMLANMLWPGEDPIGRQIAEDERRVVGVVGNVRHQSLEEGFTGELYIPIRQTGGYASVDLVVRTDLAPGGLAAAVRAALAPVAPE